MLRTPEQYIESLRDGRAVYWQGELVEDVTSHPGFQVPIATGCRDYRYDRDGRLDFFTYSGEDGERHPRLFQVPTTPEELEQRVELIQETTIVGLVVGALFALLHVRDDIAQADPAYRDNIDAFYRHCRDNDLRLAEVITDAKGDRSRHALQQDDPDLYLRVVERRPDGVVVRGAKAHITAAAIVHELMVLPTKAMGPGEEDYSIAFAVPVNAPGVKIMNRAYGEPGRGAFDYPLSGTSYVPEGFVVFDDVFVPNERIFLNGQTRLAATFAHALGLWERVGSLIEMAERAKLLVGAAQLIAEYNGIEKASHIQEKITEMIFYAELLRMTIADACAKYQTTPGGMIYPNPLAVNVGKYYGAANYHQIVQRLHDIAGGLVVTIPGEAEYNNPELKPYLEKYLHTKPEVRVEDRMRLYNLIRDLTADTYGGWQFVTTIQAGGGLAAQKIVTYRTYDLEAARQAARRAANINQPVPVPAR